MATVILTQLAQNDFNNLLLTIQARVTEIIARLAKWPAVSGAKVLTKNLEATGASALGRTAWSSM